MLLIATVRQAAYLKVSLFGGESRFTTPTTLQGSKYKALRYKGIIIIIIFVNFNATFATIRIMKLTLHNPEGQNLITGHSKTEIFINAEPHQAPLIVMGHTITPWQFDAVDAAAFGGLLAMRPELVVFGSGAIFKFPDPRIGVEFAKLGIGFDVMDTPAACRTYNVLLSEGRNVAAALLL